jgi:hypothetical protein
VQPVWPADEIDWVRKHFYRGSNIGSIPGTVRLHLVDQIARRHGSALRIDSELGRGPRRTESLPGAGSGPLAEDALEQNPISEACALVNSTFVAWGFLPR